MTDKKTLLQKLDAYILTHASSNKTSTFSLTDVTGITGETLPGRWLYETIHGGLRYTNVWLSGSGKRGNIYLIGYNAAKK